MNKGRLQSGDEPTANYSDDENAEDDTATRRNRREATRIVKASVNHLASSLASDKDLRKGQIVSMNTMDADGNIGINLVAIEHADEETYRRVRNLDRNHYSQLLNEPISYPDDTTQRNIETPGFRVIMSTRALLDRWTDSHYWKRDLIIAGVALALGAITFIIAWREFSPYWR